MCDLCVMNAVKDRLLSRRDLFRSASAAGAGALLGASAAPAVALGASSGQMADMTHVLDENFPTFSNKSTFHLKQRSRFEKVGFNTKEIVVNEHSGTHIDAPLHFSADGASVDEIPVERLIVPLAVIDIRAKAAENADSQLTPDDLKCWTDTHGPFPKGCCVAMNSGWAANVNTPRFRNADWGGTLHFPGFHVEAVQMLLEEGDDIAGIAVDTLSLDIGPSPDFPTHCAWLPTGRWGLECIANLDQVPHAGATLIVGAPKFKGGTGGPSRVFTLF